MARKTTVVDRDLGWVDIVRRLRTAPDIRLLVGVDDSDGDDLPDIAERNEFGDGHVPERSFLRATVDANRDNYLRELADAEDAYIIDGVSPEHALDALGQSVVEDIQDRITAHIDPPNAPSTIERKGSDTPLVDTGRLFNAINYRIEEG